ncbi:DUF1415 domain-containing protein [Corticibacter populi]|uniref:DUF1415 domain-containing protein n=1 Tax=Corticibacter populi TaxID=1550736 RepID=A0A3M6QYH3_9BURK|nr:DUF1415 domain-containing protein [Corticibacter populi]RMX08076.1 DUF1415 domain-containing protein [Corticibacter populi]RZS35324.1 hypothetical protein EV687_0387 [Corticibacter populi]
MSTESNTAATDAAIIAATRRWVDVAVISLNLCPFAKAVQHKGQVHYAVSHAQSEDALLKDLARELLALADAERAVRDTTLLAVPDMLQDFLDFNDFLALADELLERLGLAGELQVADFHPHYQFAGTEPDDVENCTNRAPYPTLHLLRESSIDQAVEAFPQASDIFERNIEVLRAMGMEGWRALDVGPAVQPSTSTNSPREARE